MNGPPPVDFRPKEIVDIWNARRAAGAEVWMYPTIAAAMAAGCPWLHFICTSCHQRDAVDPRRFEQHRAASVSSIIPEIACTYCQQPGEIRLYRLSSTQSIADKSRADSAIGKLPAHLARITRPTYRTLDVFALKPASDDSGNPEPVWVRASSRKPLVKNKGFCATRSEFNYTRIRALPGCALPSTHLSLVVAQVERSGFSHRGLNADTRRATSAPLAASGSKDEPRPTIPIFTQRDIYSLLRSNSLFSEALIIQTGRDPIPALPARTSQPEKIGRRGIMTQNRSLLFAVAAAAALMISAPAFAQGAAPKLHEGRYSAYVPYSLSITDTTREGMIHAN